MENNKRKAEDIESEAKEETPPPKKEAVGESQPVKMETENNKRKAEDIESEAKDKEETPAPKKEAVGESQPVNMENNKRKAEDIESEAKDKEETPAPKKEAVGESKPVSAETKAKILKQVDFYFGDSNFRRDKFLLERTSQDPEGYLPLSVLLTFQKLKALTEDPLTVAEAVSSSEIVEVSECKTKIKRKNALPSVDDSDKRTAYVKGLGFDNPDMSVDALKTIFAPFGEIGWCRLIFKNTNDKGEKKRTFVGTALVEFLTLEGMEKAMDARPEYKGKRLSFEKKKDRDATAAGGGGKAKELEDDGSYPKGWVVKATNVHHDAEWADLRDALKEHALAEFVDQKKGEGVAVLRFSSRVDALKVATAHPDGLEFHGQRVALAALAGAEEEAYWQGVPPALRLALAARDKEEGQYEEGLLLKVTGLKEETTWIEFKNELKERGAEVRFTQIEAGVGTARLTSKEAADKFLADHASFEVGEATWTVERIEGLQEAQYYKSYAEKRREAGGAGDGGGKNRDQDRYKKGIVLLASELPDKMHWKDLKDAVTEKGGDVKFIQTGADNKAYLKMANKENAENFVKDNPELEIEGTTVKFSKVEGDEEREFHRLNSGGGGRFGGRGGGRGGRGGRGRGRGRRRN